MLQNVPLPYSFPHRNETLTGFVCEWLTVSIASTMLLNIPVPQFPLLTKIDNDSPCFLGL